jgi:anti-sigma factor ChrR (cupin superfamily)
MTRKFFAHSEDSTASAALFALGSLRGDEKAAFAHHVHEGCSVCEQELDGLADVMENLALATTPADPSGTVRRRLLDSLTAEPQGPVVQGSDVQRLAARPELLTTTTKGILLHQPGLLIARSADMPWEQVAPGISRKILSVDPGRSYSTCLIRAEAGARYPSHRHADVEELLVLEGDLHVHGVVMRTGDYCRAEPDSIHEETFTEFGCLLLQVASQLDQMQA